MYIITDMTYNTVPPTQNETIHLAEKWYIANITCIAYQQKFKYTCVHYINTVLQLPWLKMSTV